MVERRDPRSAATIAALLRLEREAVRAALTTAQRAAAADRERLAAAEHQRSQICRDWEAAIDGRVLDPALIAAFSATARACANAVGASEAATQRSTENVAQESARFRERDAKAAVGAKLQRQIARSVRRDREERLTRTVEDRSLYHWRRT